MRIKNKTCNIIHYQSFIDLNLNYNDNKYLFENECKKAFKNYFGNEDGKICAVLFYYWEEKVNIVAKRDSINDDIKIYTHDNDYESYNDFVNGYDVLTNNIDVISKMIENNNQNEWQKDAHRRSETKKKLLSIIEFVQKNKNSKNLEIQMEIQETYYETMRVLLEHNNKI